MAVICSIITVAPVRMVATMACWIGLRDHYCCVLSSCSIRCGGENAAGWSMLVLLLLMQWGESSIKSSSQTRPERASFSTSWDVSKVGPGS